MSPGCAWQLATSPATNVFPKHPLSWPFQQIKPPHNPWWSVPLTSLNVSTISGWLARHCVLAMSAVCVCHCVSPWVCLHLLIYVWIYLRLCVFFLSFFYIKQEKKGHVILAQVNQELHTGEGCCSMDLPDHVNEVPWLCSHWSIIDLFVSYLPNRHSDPEHVYFAMRNVKKDWKFPQCAH